MVRNRRLAFLSLVAAPVAFAIGCSSTPSCPGEHPFLDRFRRHPKECCEGTAVSSPVVSDGPVLTEGAAPVAPPTGGSCGTPAPISPAPTPRLVPTPNAQAQPYYPPVPR